MHCSIGGDAGLTDCCTEGVVRQMALVEDRASREGLEAAAELIVQRNGEKLLEVGLDEGKVRHSTDGHFGLHCCSMASFLHSLIRPTALHRTGCGRPEALFAENARSVFCSPVIASK